MLVSPSEVQGVPQKSDDDCNTSGGNPGVRALLEAQEAVMPVPDVMVSAR